MTIRYHGGPAGSRRTDGSGRRPQHPKTVRTETVATEPDEITPTPQEPTTPRSGATGRSCSCGSRPLAALSLFVVFLVAAVADVRDDLLHARSAMERGRDQLLDGDATDAAASFERGRELFADAEDRVGGPILRPVTWLPVLGRTLDAVSAIAGSGTSAAEAGARSPTPWPSSRAGSRGCPHRRQDPVERIPPLADAAAEADVLMTDAIERLDASPDSLLIGPVASARRDAQDQLGDLQETVHTAAGVLGGLPEFLGADGPRRYFFGAQNPASSAGRRPDRRVLDPHDRRRPVPFSPFSTIYGSGSPLSELPAPNEDFAETTTSSAARPVLERDQRDARLPTVAQPS